MVPTHQHDVGGLVQPDKTDKWEVQKGEREIQHLGPVFPVTGERGVGSVRVVPPLWGVPGVGEEHVLGVAESFLVCLHTRKRARKRERKGEKGGEGTEHGCHNVLCSDI